MRNQTSSSLCTKVQKERHVNGKPLKYEEKRMWEYAPKANQCLSHNRRTDPLSDAQKSLGLGSWPPCLVSYIAMICKKGSPARKIVLLALSWDFHNASEAHEHEVAWVEVCEWGGGMKGNMYIISIGEGDRVSFFFLLLCHWDNIVTCINTRGAWMVGGCKGERGGGKMEGKEEEERRKRKKKSFFSVVSYVRVSSSKLSHAPLRKRLNNLSASKRAVFGRDQVSVPLPSLDPVKGYQKMPRCHVLRHVGSSNKQCYSRWTWLPSSLMCRREKKKRKKKKKKKSNHTFWW